MIAQQPPLPSGPESPNPLLDLPVPGPDAPAYELRAFRYHVGGIRACLPYDYAILLCRWCLADDDHRYPDLGATRGGTLKFCSERCQEAAAKWREIAAWA